MDLCATFVLLTSFIEIAKISLNMLCNVRLLHYSPLCQRFSKEPVGDASVLDYPEDLLDFFSFFYTGYGMICSTAMYFVIW